MSTRPAGGELDALLRDACAHGAIPGAVLVIVGPDGVQHAVTAGNLPDGAETMFRLASMTKAVTSVAALQLVEQGRLALDVEVASLLPVFGTLQVLERFDGDTPVLRPPARQATVRQLLCHTAGPGYWFANAALLRWHEVSGVPPPISGLRTSLLAPLVADPGTRWEYGTSTDWLGLVIEAVSGTPLDAYLAAHVFGPLGMRQATFAPTPAQRARLMPVFARGPDGALALVDMEFPVAPDFWPGGHGVYDTAGDYARFLRALLGGGELDGARVLRPETVDLMFSDQLGGIALPTAMPSAVPELANEVPLSPFRQTWGLGLHVTMEDVPGMRRAGTGDWAGLFNSYYWVDRASGVAVVFFTQVLPFFDAAVVDTLLGIESAIYREERPTGRAAGSAAP
jgi:methyl acetate hydrolase